MAPYFGQKSAYQIYVTKIRWIVGLLLTLIFVLVGGLFLVLQHPNESLTVAGTAEASIAPPPPTAPMGRVIVTKTGIESGVMITRDMLEPRELPLELMTPNIFPAAEITSVEGRYLKTSLPSGALVSRTDITEIQPINPFQIPSGYRAVTIVVNASTGVEGFAKPTSSVDVMWIYDDTSSKEKTIATIVRNTKVLAVGRVTTPEAQQVAAQGNYTATLLATERDAKSIQLASTSGILMLSLVGDEEPKLDDFSADAVSVGDLLKSRIQKKDPNTCLVKDPNTGRLVKFVFRNNNWGTEQITQPTASED